jgi:hypothetical protein
VHAALRGYQETDSRRPAIIDIAVAGIPLLFSAMVISRPRIPIDILADVAGCGGVYRTLKAEREI